MSVKGDFYSELVKRFKAIAEAHNLLEEEIVITGRALSVEEAIGSPERRDYPIVKGKEKLMQAEFRGVKGQAFTDMAGNFRGTLQEVLNNPLESNFDRAVLIATMNAIGRYLGLIEKTIHCHDEQPEQCAEELVAFIQKEYGTPRIALIGYQPAMFDRLAKAFPLRAVDLDPDNIGKTKSGVRIEAYEATKEVLEWADIIVATGSTVVNSTITDYCNQKPALFFGTTAAATCHLMGLQRFCARGE
ncbi:Rossmann-like domain-containing protein [Syntrophomonas curvata]